MNVANSVQVGGNHYKSSFQHWDWVTENGMGYLDGAASKYVSRWRKKAGLQDLEKARHFVVKLRESFMAGREVPVIRAAANVKSTHEFCVANGLDAIESHIMIQLSLYHNVAGADEALRGIDQLIATCPVRT